MHLSSYPFISDLLFLNIKNVVVKDIQGLQCIRLLSQDGPGVHPEPFQAGPRRIACKEGFSVFKLLVDDFILVYWSYLQRGQF